MAADYSENEKRRPLWSYECDGLAVTLSYSISWGGLWWFAYSMHKGGGFLYMIPYILAMIFLGFPMIILQMSIGQFCSRSSLSSRVYSPMFRGLGICLLIANFILLVNNSYKISICVRYFIASLTASLPWSSCLNWWNTQGCRDARDHVHEANTSYGEPSSEQFFRIVVMKDGGFQWELALCTLFILAVAFVILILDVRSLGKVSYVTLFLPFAIIIALVIRSATLPYSVEGVEFYLYPAPSRLLDIQVWVDAFKQVFFEMGIAGSIFVSLSSFHRFHNNIFRDAVAVCLSHLLMTLLCASMVFGFTGALAWWEERSMDEVIVPANLLVFDALPRLFAYIPIGSTWSALLFLFHIVIGMGTLCPLILNITSQITDEIKWFRQCRIVATFLVCLAVLIGSLILCIGNDIWIIFDWYVVPVFMFAALAEVISVGWFYGARKLADDFKVMMACSCMCSAWKVWCMLSWYFTAPLILAVMILVTIIYWPGVVVHAPWIVGTAWMMVVAILAIIPGYICYYGLRRGFGKSLWDLLQPSPEWKPVLERHQEQVANGPGQKVQKTDGCILQMPPAEGYSMQGAVANIEMLDAEIAKV